MHVRRLIAKSSLNITAYIILHIFILVDIYISIGVGDLNIKICSKTCWLVC